MPVTGQKRGCGKSGNRAPLLMRVSVVAHNHVILGIETRKKKAVLDQFLEEQRKEGFLGRVYIFAVQYFSPKETNSFANLANTRILGKWKSSYLETIKLLRGQRGTSETYSDARNPFGPKTTFDRSPCKPQSRACFI
jgi:hypothetical protein